MKMRRENVVEPNKDSLSIASKTGDEKGGTGLTKAKTMRLAFLDK